MSLYKRFKTILTVTGRPAVLAWWGVALWLAALILIWADFIPYVLQLFLAAFCGGFGMFMFIQAGELKRRQNGR
jgi:hypothetical protein